MRGSVIREPTRVLTRKEVSVHFHSNTAAVQTPLEDAFTRASTDGA